LKKLRFSPNNIGIWLKDLKTKIVSFDIKPSKPIADDLLDQAFAAINARQFGEALNYFDKVLANNNSNYLALMKAIELCTVLGKIVSARKLLRIAFKFYPNDHEFYELSGDLYLKTGALKASAKAYRQTLALNPDLARARHMLNAVTQVDSQSAPRQYIIDMFDSYAHTFERSLIQDLGYRAHFELVNYMQMLAAEDLSTNLYNSEVLDLGCGTGLLGQELVNKFKPKSLIGVDLSSSMLALSSAKNIYTELHNTDLLEYLEQAEQHFDIIGSSDVLIYMGDLSSVFNKAQQRLKQGGYFGFSLEALEKGTFKLDLSGRYKHSLAYVEQLSSTFNFSRIYSKLIDLRKEQGKMVPGYLVLLQK
jgi:predicted TPR repeat methyltransferase